MRNIIQLALLVTLGSFATGCATTYWKDRANDLTDFAHIEQTDYSYGAMVNVGPIPLGAYIIGCPPDAHVGRTKYGFGGVVKERTYGVCLLVISGQDNITRNPSKQYGSTYVPWGSVGLTAGVRRGIGARFDFVEFLDFLLGIVGTDILYDDTHATRPPPSWEKPEEPWREQFREEERQRLKESNKAMDDTGE